MSKEFIDKEEVRYIVNEILSSEHIDAIGMADDDGTGISIYLSDESAELESALLGQLNTIKYIQERIKDNFDEGLNFATESIEDLTEQTLYIIEQEDDPEEWKDVLEILQEGIDDNNANIARFDDLYNRIQETLEQAKISVSRFYQESTGLYRKAYDDVKDSVEKKLKEMN